MCASSVRRSKDRKSYGTPFRDDSVSQNNTPRPSKRSRHPDANDSSFEGNHPRDLHYASLVRHRDSASTISSLNVTRSDTDSLQWDEMLSSTQQKFIELWCHDFLNADTDISLFEDRITGLATAIDGEHQPVMGYTRQQHLKMRDARPRTNISPLLQSAYDPPSDYNTPSGQNSHLPSPTRTLVEKYVAACRRRRSQTDGRRSVNTGPFKCSFGCGYRTKRAFDWRRHEETHEPQELWLCELCCQTDTLNPFLVNRKDKFLRHAADKHPEYTAESVLDRSKVSYVARTAEGCPYCGVGDSVRGWSWDERCKHILRHFEDDIERSLKRPIIISEGQQSDESRGHRASVEGRADSAASDSGDGHGHKHGF